MNSSPPTTSAGRAIEAGRRRTRELYYVPGTTSQLDEWYLDEVQDPHIAQRVKDLYEDREQTKRQRNSLFVAKMRLAKPKPHDSSTLIETYHDMEVTYTRALELYHARVKLMQQESITRLSIWSAWVQERQKPYYRQNEDLLAACESTISYMEDDYIKRKAEFVVEVYAVLEKHDAAQAKVVLDDLGTMYTWLKEDFIRRLECCVVAYDGLKQVR